MNAIEKANICCAAVTPNDLVREAARALELMFDRETQFFCHRLTPRENGFVLEGASYRYSIMTLLGLHRYQSAGFSSPIATSAAVDNLLRKRDCIDSLGDIGLTLWLSAVVAPQYLPNLYADLNVDAALRRCPDGLEGRTMELAWFLTGLAYASLANSTGLPDLSDLSFTCFRLLTRNQGRSGIFGHQAASGGFASTLRGRIGSFADQVYPIYALVRFAEAYNNQVAIEKAKWCAEAICRSQGPMGQWWWHYDAPTGKVFRQYPVYSVHQHGMAPMALLALQDATQLPFNKAILKGVNWIYQNNELHVDMRDRSSGIIWRSIRRKGRKIQLGDFSHFLNSSRIERPNKLEVLFECRPYELGWLLYAFSERRTF